MNRIQNNTGFVAGKAVMLGGRTYSPGEPVNTAGLTDHKIAQLLRQRILRPYVKPKDSA